MQRNSSTSFTNREILPAKSLIFCYTRGNANRSSCPFHVVDYIFRAITFGIGGAPHRLAKVLAKSLSRSLGSISDTPINNTSEMMDKISEVTNVGDKKEAIFNVKTLFTNVPVHNALEAMKNVVEPMAELVKIRMKFNCFSYKGN